MGFTWQPMQERSESRSLHTDMQSETLITVPTALGLDSGHTAFQAANYSIERMTEAGRSRSDVALAE
jgi:hypothetical protein